MRITVFIQNEAGSKQKHRHDEKTLEFESVEVVSRPYPFPYGFVLGTTAEDGLNVDCFVITKQKLKSGQIVECESIGLMEQVDEGAEDHNVLARMPDEDVMITPHVEETLIDFVRNAFEHVPDKQVEPGRFLGGDAAAAHVRSCADDPGQSYSGSVKTT